MRCPFCRHPSTSVVDSRAPKPGFVIRRRRQCPACGKRFTTFERVAIAMPWIIKRGGGRVAGRPHIAPAEQAGIEQLQSLIGKALK